MPKDQTQEEDEWTLASGLPDDVDIWIIKSRFGFVEEYQEGKAPLLLWDVESPDADFDRPIIWPIGSGWEVKERGLKVEHPKRNRFIETSGYGRLITRCKELAMDDRLRSKGSPRDARIWEGMGFHVVRESFEIKGGAERGLPEKWEHLMPTDFLGFKGEVVETAKPAAKASTARAAVKQAGGVRDKLTTLAKKLDSRDAFQKAALNIPEVSDDGALLTEVLDDSEEGFHARARA